jgi:hypothetical protein
MTNDGLKAALQNLMLSHPMLWLYTQQHVRIGLETHHIGHYWFGMRWCSHITLVR